MNNKTFVSIIPSFARILAVICCLLAIGAWFRLDIKTFPDRSVPEYSINLTVPKLSSAEVDESVTRKVEEAVRALGSTLTMTSESRTGSATITVKTSERIGSDYKERLEKKLGEVTKQLPVKEYSVSQSNLADSKIGFYVLYGTDLQTLSDIAQNTVYDKLINLPGIARIEIDKQALREQVDIIFRPSMLLAYGLTPADVLSQLPTDVVGEEVGSVGAEADRTIFQWTSKSEGLQGLGKQLISTDKGYVPLNMLADIRDRRGSKGEQIGMYQGSPALGITVYAADVGQLPVISNHVHEAVEELNQASGGKYRLDLFRDDAQTITVAVRQLGALAVLTAIISSLCLYLTRKSLAGALLALLANVLAVGSVLGGMWLSGIPLSLSTLGPLILFSLLFTGAGSALFHQFSQLPSYSFVRCLQVAWSLMKPFLLTVVVVAACWTGVVFTDFLKAEEKVVLYDAWPVLLLGTFALILVYGFIMPVLTGSWLEASERVEKQMPRTSNKVATYFQTRWERLVELGYLPYGITLVASIVFVFLLKSFILVDPYAKLDYVDKSLSLPMVQGSSIDEAMRAAQIAEERLLAIAEVRDVYTIASEEKLTFQLLLVDKYDRTRSISELEKELDKELRDIPQTDPFALVINEEKATRLVLTIMGPSLQTTQNIANEVLAFMEKQTVKNKDGRELVTDERVGEGAEGTFIDIRPKQEMLARYRITQEEIKRQLESYLGEKTVGSVYWNDRQVPIHIRFPDGWMDYPDQVKNILIRTSQGTVRLSELVDWSIGSEPAIYQREDGLYVFKVSSAVSDPSRIELWSYIIPYTMQEKVTMPEGYTVYNDNELNDLEEKKLNKVDWSSRVLTVGTMVAIVLIASLLLQRRTRDGIFALVLLPALSGGFALGLLWLDRPMNVMGFYGMAAAVAVIVLQTLLAMDELYKAQAEQERVWEGIKLGAKRVMTNQAGIYISIGIASLPLAGGLGVGNDSFASFASVLLFGIVMGAFSTMVLLPGMQNAATQRQAAHSEMSLPTLIRHVRIWWENGQVRRRDRKERQREQDRTRKKGQAEAKDHNAREYVPVKEDFLPLSSSTQDVNR
ncbi:efflux RND transporter permease subunit [Brevibacillus sp. 179-C9.3 HS]|uniref:efflux RND transporter permease subunit n=1 Tax=unclassified Brevibacillus TaxID=2684853 RepID=UPI0039A19E34